MAPLPAQRGGAKALLLTVLGEFVLPLGGAAWTSSIVAAAEALGVGEKNARQALSRIGEQGLIESERHGRVARWSLTPTGRQLLESGTRRIYEFGAAFDDWQGEWLVAHCRVAEAQRSARAELRTTLGFLGFGEVSASLLISPHVDRETELRETLTGLGLLPDSTILRATTGSIEESTAMVRRAWNLTELAQAYEAFVTIHDRLNPNDGEAAFCATVALVHDWRRFPFIDPELPRELLPDQWVGAAAAALFNKNHRAWSPVAQDWFATC